MVAELRAPNRPTEEILFNHPDEAEVSSGTERWRAPKDVTILGVLVNAGDPPTGGELIFDVVLDAYDGGGSIYTTTANRPTVLAGEFEGTSPAPDISHIPAGHYLTVDTLMIGLINPGSKITLQILFE